jgi:mono/diheme cytochrome c family protein
MSARFLSATGAALAASLSVWSAAQDLPRFDKARAEAGAEVFRESCAACHGQRGKGDGPLAEKLHFSPPDLTTLGQRTHGGFSFESTRRIVDGRNPLKGHGGPEMPVWGDAFRTRDEGYSEARVARKIDDVVHFLASIQAR